MLIWSSFGKLSKSNLPDVKPDINDRLFAFAVALCVYYMYFYSRARAKNANCREYVSDGHTLRAR